MRAFTFGLQRFAVVTNASNDTLVTGTAGSDTISNSGSNVTINAGTGDDSIYLSNGYSGSTGNNVIVYNAGDGNDTIYGLEYGNATLQIATGNLKSVTSTDGMNLLLHVDNDIITIQYGWASLDTMSPNHKLNIVDANGNDLLSTITPVRFIDGSTYSNYNNTPNISLVGSDNGDTITNNGGNVTISTFDGDDSISNSADSVTIDAGAGNDSINNGYSNVSIYAGDGDDSISLGGGSNVTINAGAGNDSIYLSNGYSGSSTNNVIVYNSGDGNDTIYGLDNGNATLQIASGEVKSVTSTDGMNLLLHVDNDIITIQYGWASLDTMYSSNHKLNIVDADGNDLLATITPVRFVGNTYNNSNYIPNISVVGTDGNDTITNNGGNVTISTFDGDDSISNSADSVTIDAGAGNDKISNTASLVSIYAGDGDDSISLGGGSNVTINAGTGNDSIYLSSGGYGTSTGNNVIVYNAGDGNDTIFGLDTSGATLQIASGEVKSVTSNDGMNLLLHVDNDIITIEHGWHSLDTISPNHKLNIVDANGHDLLSSITPVRFIGGTNYSNSNNTPNISLVGSDNNDTISNNGGNVTISTFDGDDSISNSADSVTIDAGDGNDKISNTASLVSIYAGDGDDSISLGGGSNVTINAGTGNDSIYLSSGGYDSSTGNVIVYNSGDGNDTIYGLDISGATLQIATGNLKSVTSTDGMNLLLHVDNDIITIEHGWHSLETMPSHGKLNIVDADGNDLLSTITPVRFVGTNYSNSNYIPNISVVGTDGNDTISNSGGNVTISTFDGDDSISNSADSVTIDAGDGNDKISNTASLVSIYAGDGDDSISLGGGSNVTINAGTGNDSIYLSNGYSGSTGNNVIVYNSGDGNDTIQGLDNGNATLQIATGNLKSVTSTDGMNLLLHVDNDIITIEHGWHALDTMPSHGKLNIVDADGNELLSSITPVRFIDGTNYSNYNYTANISLVGSDNGDTITNNSGNVTISTFDGDDSISNSADSVTIDAGDGNDKISNTASLVSIYAGDGDDSISLGGGSNVTINAGTGNDSIYLSSGGYDSSTGNVIVYNSGDGNDTIFGLDTSGATLQIASGEVKSVTSNDGMNLLLHVDNDIITIEHGWHSLETMPSHGKLNIVDANGHDLLSSITPVRFIGGNTYNNSNYIPNISVVGTDGSDTISNNGGNVTITGGAGDDSISLISVYGSTGNNVIVYNAGDGNDTVTGFDATSTLQIGGDTDTYSTTKSGNDVIVTVGDGSVKLVGAASLSAVNITVEEGILLSTDWTITDDGASYKNLFTITGLKADITGDDLEANVSIGGSTVTVKENVLGTDEVTISEGYTLALAPTVPKAEEISATWNVNGTTATFTGEHVTTGYAVVDSTIIHRDATEAATFTLTGLKAGVTTADLEANVTVDDTTVTVNEKVLGDMDVTISEGYELALADDVTPSEEVPATWNVNGTTATFADEHTTAGYVLDDEGTIVHVAATDAATFTLTGINETLTADDLEANVTVDDTTVTLNENVLGTATVTISEGYTLALDDEVLKSEEISATWDIDDTTATFTGDHITEGYVLDNNTIVHREATKIATFTLTGVKQNLTATVLDNNVTIDGSTVTVNENVLDTGELVISGDGYTLALASTVTKSEEIPAIWNVSGTTATFADEHITAGYVLDDEGTIVHRDATEFAIFTLTGVKQNLTATVLADNVTIDDTTVTLNENVLGTATVTISEGYELALDDDVTLSENTEANWDISDAGDTSTAIYTSGGTTAGYALVDNKISYVNATGGTFTLTGLSTTFAADNATVDGNKVTLSAAALGQANVKLTTTDGFTLKLGDDCPTVTNVAKGWTLEDTTATYRDAGKSDGYKLKDSKNITYTPAVVGKTLLTVTGLKDDLTVTDGAIDGLTVSGKTLTVTPDVVGENFSTDGGYKVIFSEGDYDGSTFTGTTGKDTIEVNGSGLVLDLGDGNDTVTSNGDGGNTYLFDADGDKDVVKGYNSADTIKITDGSEVSVSVKSSDIIVKAGSATMTLKNAATGTQLTVVDADDETLIDQTVYADRIVVDNGATLLPAFNSSSFATDETITKVDGSAVSRKFSLTGGDEDNTLIGGTGANFVNGNGGTNELTGGKGNDTFAVGNGNDIITDYGVGTDKISLAADVTDFAVDGDDVVLTFDDDKSATITGGVGKKINFMQNGKSSTEIFDEGGKTNTAKTSITLASAVTDYTASTAMLTIDGGLTENVSIVGNAKNNKIFGSSGDDVLNGKNGNDTLTGGDGADIFVYETGKDVITDYDSDADKISLAAAATSESVKSNGDVFLKFGSNSLTIKNVGDTSDGRTIVFAGDDGDDTTKTYFSERIVGSDGVTLMSSFAGNFTVDDLSKVDGSATTKKITLTGGDNGDTLNGGTGVNILNGNAGDDLLIGNGGSDTFVYSSGNDTIGDYESKDRISLTSAMTNFDLNGDDVIIGFGDGSLTIADAANSAITFVETTNGRVTTNVNVFAADGIFNKAKTAVTLSPASDNYTATSAIISIDGGLVTDAIEIVGNTKANKIFAGDAGATLNGGTGNDSLWGGDGDDTFVYSSGKDVIYGFGDNDELQFSGDFTAAVNGDDVVFKIGSTAKAVTLKDITTDVVVNGETYAISDGAFVKKN